MRGASVSVTFTATSTDGLVCYSGPQDGNTGNIPIRSVPVTLTSSVTTGAPGTNIACWNTGKQGILITITRFAITYNPNLKVGDLQVSQPGATQDPQSGILQVVPNVPVQVDVPISGFTGFDAPSGASTTVTLKAGSQTLPPKTVLLSDIPDTGNKIVTFFVTFKPEDAGAQTITATVDPDNTLGESVLSDNTSPIQVNVLPKYKLVASVKNAEVVKDGPSLIVRVDPSNLHVCNADIQPDVKSKAIHVECKDDKGKSVNGCQFRIVGEFPSDANDGGHDRSNHPSRPTQLFAEAFPLNFAPIDATGADFSYKVPDASGEVDLRILGKGPNGEDLDPFVIRVRVQTPGLVPINVANLGFVNLNTHTAGVYGTSALNTALATIVTKFRATLADAKVLPQNMPNLESEGANLPWGGLFDIGEDHLTPGWSEPHCGHRGNNIDITVSDLSEPEKDALQKAIRKATLTTPYEPESPGFNDSHWHLQK